MSKANQDTTTKAYTKECRADRDGERVMTYYREGESPLLYRYIDDNRVGVRLYASPSDIRVGAFDTIEQAEAAVPALLDLAN